LQPNQSQRKRRYPLVVFLHGAGERGDDNEAQLRHGVREFATPANRKKFPCFVIAPQCPKNQKWADWSAIKPSARPSAALRRVEELIEHVEREHRVDPDRIYVTGMSMGGFGTWSLLRRQPNKFAAAVMVCGGGDEADAPKFVNIPIWAFHGARDDAVPVERSRKMIAAIEKAGGKPKYTEYPNVGHDSWTLAYKDSDMLAWLFAQSRGRGIR
jgi:predicted peptidase